mmetsp:Transcript_2641/g.7894  ORF Transcript_2641/g.7894 Transcript_2641/m.7894 type:complete len:285 (+) Transcript_2641:273-1127(+)
MVSMVRFQGELFLRLHLLFLQLVHLHRKDRLGCCRGVNTVRLDGNDHPTAVLEKETCIVRHNPCLIRLSNVGEDDVHHADEHPVPLWLSRILDDGHHIRASLRHVRQVAPRTMRELHGIDDTLGANHVRDVRHRCSGGTSQVQHLGSRFDGHGANATNDTCAQLRPERVPHAVLHFLLAFGALHSDSLFAVDGLTRGHVPRDKGIIPALRDEHTLETVRLHHNLCGTLLAVLAALLATLGALLAILAFSLSLSLCSLVTLAFCFASFPHGFLDLGRGRTIFTPA